MSGESEAILEVNGVSKSFQTAGSEIKVLREAALHLRTGQITGIIGPSGSGKTTMLMIAGLLDVPDAGEVRFDGRRVSFPGVKLEHLRDLRRKHIGFVFQKANLIPFLNACDNVAVALEIAGTITHHPHLRLWATLSAVVCAAAMLARALVLTLRLRAHQI